MSSSTPTAPALLSRPILTTEWTTDSIDTGAIYDEVTRLWEQVGGVKDRPHAFDEPDPDVAVFGGGLMRATTLNLVAVAPSDKDADLIANSVGRLHDFLPSRTVILVLRTPEGGEDTIPYGVRVDLREQIAEGNQEPSLKFETITIEADAREAGRLASVVSPLLMSELPNYLWWPSGDFARHPLFEDLLSIVDRLIVDSAQLGRDVRGVAALRDLIDSGTTVVLGDFTWLRLGPWRQLIAQFFDGDDTQTSLQTIESVTISYAETRADGSSGLASALLMLGWLGSRLGWEVVDPLEQRAGTAWVPLLARNGDRQRTIQVRLVSDRSSALARFSLRSVELTAAGDAPGVFKVERTDEDDLITSSELPTMPLVSRMVYSKRPDSESMLKNELQRLTADRIFEDALRFATRLLP